MFMVSGPMLVSVVASSTSVINSFEILCFIWDFMRIALPSFCSLLELILCFVYPQIFIDYSSFIP